MKKHLALLLISAMLFSMVAPPASASAALQGESMTARAGKAPGKYHAATFTGKVGSNRADSPVCKATAPQPADLGLDEALNFEGGSIRFTSEGDYPWNAVEDGSRSFAVSGNIGVHSSVSVLEAQVTAQEGDVLQFEFTAWGEGSSQIYDECSFTLDGEMLFSYGELVSDWQLFVTPLSAGVHTLSWAYRKDENTNPVGDLFAVDNVYVGQPMHVESISAAGELEIPVNRSGAIEWTVLPWYASNKEVTFVSVDPSVASVNGNGVVFGVAEGETSVVITSVDDPSVSAECSVRVVDTQLELVRLYGIAAGDPDHALDGQWISFTSADPGTVSSLGSAPACYAAAYAYGSVYGFTAEGDLFRAPFDDLGSVTVIGHAAGRLVLSLAMNYIDGIMYGVAVDEDDGLLLAAIDTANGTVRDIAYLTAQCVNIAIDENGVAYGVGGDGNLYRINLQTGGCTIIGDTGMYLDYAQDICCDFNTGDLYWAQYYNSYDNGLRRLNKTGGGCEFIGRIGGGIETCGMFVVPENEPEQPEVFHVTGVEVSPSGLNIRVGGTAQLTAVVSPLNASNTNVEWTVDDESIAAVDQNGNVLGLAEGTATVCVTTAEGGFTAYAEVNVSHALGSYITGYCFETDPLGEGWTFVDADGDGFNWGWDNVTYTPYEGSGLIFSASYDNPSYTPLTPDNWAISPLVALPAGSADATLYAKGQDPDFPAENFALYVGTSPDIALMTKVAGDFTAGSEYAQYSADLSAYCGQTVCFAIRHYNVSDEFILNVDQVEFRGGSDAPSGLPGDVDLDGRLSFADAALLYQYVIGQARLTGQAAVNADVNLDEAVGMLDVAELYQKVIGSRRA